MLKPVFDGQIDQAATVTAQAKGLPEIGGKQAISSVRFAPAGGGAVNWYALEDGSEIILDDSGNETEWPEHGA